MAKGPIDQELIAKQNKKLSAGLEADYAGARRPARPPRYRYRQGCCPGGGLRRGGAVMGGGHRRHALRALSRPRRAA